MDVIIRNTRTKDIDAILKFTDKWIGEGYYQKEELRKILLMGIKDGINASLVAEYQGEIVGIRLTLAPGEWITPDTFNITPEVWKGQSNSIGYFKSLFIAEKFQGKGLGKILSKKSMELLEKMGAKGVVCHSWVESPNNSSRRYLEKMNFSPINIHENFWYFKDYKCTRCAPKRCECSACEMIRYF